MIFVSYPSSAAGGTVEYLSGMKTSMGRLREVQPEILRGDPEFIRWLLRRAHSVNPAFNGVFSFSEPVDSNGAKLRALSDRFEKIFSAGVEDRVANGLWVKHAKAEATLPSTSTNQRCDIHFVGVNLDLRTGRHLKPLFPPRDKRVLRLFEQWFNIRFDSIDRTENPRMFVIPKTGIAKPLVQELVEIRKLAEACPAELVTIFRDHGWRVKEEASKLVVWAERSSRLAPIALKLRQATRDRDRLDRSREALDRVETDFKEALGHKARVAAGGLGHTFLPDQPYRWPQPSSALRAAQVALDLFKAHVREMSTWSEVQLGAFALQLQGAAEELHKVPRWVCGKQRAHFAEELQAALKAVHARMRLPRAREVLAAHVGARSARGLNR